MANVNIESCLICFKPSQGNIEGNEVSENLDSQLRAIFVLRKLLKLSTRSCAEILKKEASNPSTWLNFCPECLDNIQEAQNIFRQLTKLELKWKNMNEAITMKVRKCYSQHNGRGFELLKKKIREAAIKRPQVNKNKQADNKSSSTEWFIAADIKTEVKEEVSYPNLRYDDANDEDANWNYENGISDLEEQSKIDNDITIDPDMFPKRRKRSKRLQKISHAKAFQKTANAVSSGSGEDFSLENPSSTDETGSEQGLGTHPYRSEESEAIRTEDESNSKFKCTFCEKRYSSVDGKNEHENRRHGQNHYFHCTYCPKKYSTVFVLYRHLKATHNLETQKIRRSLGLGRPRAPRKIKNVSAGEAGSEKGVDVDTHQYRSEESEAIQTEDESNSKFKCTFCKKRYSSVDGKNEHENRRHGQTHYFHCTYCPKKYSTIFVLYGHLKSTHNLDAQKIRRSLGLGRPRAPRKVKNVSAGEAGSEQGVDTHQYRSEESEAIRTEDESNSKFKCVFCEKRYSSVDGKNEHENRLHGQTHYFHCTYCPKKYSTIFVLYGHLKSTHNLETQKIRQSLGLGRPRAPRKIKNVSAGETGSEQGVGTHQYRSEEKEGIKTKDESNSKFKCTFCEKRYSSVDLKNDHENRSHGQNHYFYCTHCSKQYATVFVLYRHLKSTHNLEAQKIRRSLGLGRPRAPRKIRKVSSEPPVNCKTCNKVLSCLSALQRHEKYCSSEIINVFCSYCKEGFANEKNLNFHVYKHHDKSFVPYPCAECNKRYVSFSCLEKHVSIVHRKERNFICEICSATFTEYKHLEYHQMRYHGDQDQLKCKECGKILCTPAALKKHVLVVHRREFKFRCPICNIGRICQSALDAHILVAHTKNVQRPHICTTCKKSFLTKRALEDHMRTHTKERPYKCHICPTAFYVKRRLLRHVESLHSTERPFKCEQCHKSFPSNHYLNSHVYSTHNKKTSSRPPKIIVEDTKTLKEVIARQTVPVNNRYRNFRNNQFRLKIEEKFKNPQDCNK